MPLELALEARAAAAWGALLLLPGFLVVRAPWHAVPLLSAAFWITSWGWSGLLGVSRPRFLATMLAAQGALACLRLLKPWGLRRPGGPVLAVLAAALAGLAIGGPTPGPPTPEGSALALTARLLAWSHRVPSTYEPLLPVHEFAVHTVGPAALAADVALLTGLPPARSAALVAATVPGLLLLAAFGALSRRGPAAPGALLAVAVTLASWTALWGTVAGLLAAAFVVAAAGWLIAARNRSPVVAAGLLAAAAVLSDGAVAVTGLGFAGLLAFVRGETGRDTPAGRLAWAAGVAAIAAAPLAWRLAVTATGVVGAPEMALAAGTVAGAGGGLLAGIALCDRPARARGPVRLALLAAAAGAALLASRLAGERWLPGPGDQEAARWIVERTGPLESFCVDTPGGRWIPALAGRGIRTEQPLPGLPQRTAESPAPCTYVYGAAATGGPVVYRNAEVAITRAVPLLTTFHSGARNDRLPVP
jgi:hypothetical protein